MERREDSEFRNNKKRSLLFQNFLFLSFFSLFLFLFLFSQFRNQSNKLTNYIEIFKKRKRKKRERKEKWKEGKIVSFETTRRDHSYSRIFSFFLSFLFFFFFFFSLNSEINQTNLQ